MTQSIQINNKEIAKLSRALIKDGYSSFLNNESKRQEAKKLFDFETYSLLESDRKLWDLISDIRLNIQGYEQLKSLPKGTKLYMTSQSFRSDANGNHESFQVYYIKDNELVRVLIPCLMENSKGNYNKTFKRNGGGYSFSFDIAYAISMLITDDKDGYHFKDERI